MLAHPCIVNDITPSCSAGDKGETLLGYDDITDIAQELFNVQAKAEILGQLLKLPQGTMEAIFLEYKKPLDCLMKVIGEFVKQIEPPPTWKTIANALRNPLIGEAYLARKIERKHCGLSGANNGMGFTALDYELLLRLTMHGLLLQKSITMCFIFRFLF